MKKIALPIPLIALLKSMVPCSSVGKSLGNLVANFLENVEIFQGDLQISFESNTDFPNSLLKFANFLVRCIFIG